MTPRETYILIDAASWRAEQRQQQAVSAAWLTAALTRQKRLPSLKRLLGTDRSRALDGEELERRRAEYEEIMRKMDLDKINEANRGS